MKAARIWIVLKAVISYCMKYRPYMTVWVTACVIVSIYESVRTGNIAEAVMGLLVALFPAAVKKILLTISRIGGTNLYDEKTFGRGPRGRFSEYLTGYLGKYKE